MCLEDTLDESVPGIYSEDTLDGSFPGVCSEEDAQDDLIPGVYSEDTQNESFPRIYSEEDTQDELMYYSEEETQNELTNGMYSEDELMTSVYSEEDKQEELIPGVCSEYCSYNELDETDTDFDDSDLFENNISFIQAMVQLKFSIFSSGCLTVDIMHNFLDKFVKNANLVSFSIPYFQKHEMY